MASLYTTHYNLDKYVDSDKPNLRDQYNAAMDKIDNQMYANATANTTSLATANEAKEIAQLAFDSLDELTSGSSGAWVTSNMIVDGTITATDLANNSVTAAKIANGSITTEKIEEQSIVEELIDDNAISQWNLQNNCVVSSKIASNAVTTDKIAANSVTAEKINATFTIYANGAIVLS